MEEKLTYIVNDHGIFETFSNKNCKDKYKPNRKIKVNQIRTGENRNCIWTLIKKYQLFDLWEVDFLNGNKFKVTIRHDESIKNWYHDLHTVATEFRYGGEELINA